MKRVSFSAIPGCVGKLVSNVELVLTHPKPQKIKKILTSKNKSAAFRLKKAKEGLGFHQNKLKALEALNTPKDAKVWTDTEEKILNAQTLIPVLQEQAIEKYYMENEDGTLSVPAGFWYLCERIEGDAHKNRELQPYKLPGLRPYQVEGLDALYQYNRATVELATGCHAKGQGIIMYNGAIKKVEDIIAGDQLMGPDGTSRQVMRLVRGHQQMAKIVPAKGDPWVVNLDHVLCLKLTPRRKGQKHKIVKMSVSEYLTQSKTQKHRLKLYKTGVDFKQTSLLPIPPWILGAWLGDGHSNACAITTADAEIANEWCNWISSIGINLKIHKKPNSKARTLYGACEKASSRHGRYHPFMVTAEALGLVKDKHIPESYKTATRRDRLELLAGLLDTDGYLVRDGRTHQITTISDRLRDDILFLARSLGFAAHSKAVHKTCQTGGGGVYNTITISGDTSSIPCRLERKRAQARRQIKDPLVVGFKVELLPPDDFFGFEVSGDNLYLLSDFTVTHNCGKSKMIYSAALAGVKAGKRVMIVVPTEYLVGQVYNELKTLHEKTAALGGDFKHPKLGWEILVTTINSAPKYADIATMMLLDEAHHAPAETWSELLATAVEVTHVYNFTATAFRSDGLDTAIHSFGGPIVYARDARWGLDNGWLSPLKVIQVRINPRRPDGSVIKLPDAMPMQKAYKVLMSANNVAAFIREKLNVAIDKKRRTMCIFRTVKYAEAFRKYCGSAPKFQVAHADKKVSKDPKFPLRQFNAGETDLLVACDKLVSEGIDIPDSNLLICATQHTSDITTLQLLGRVLRKAAGKEDAVCIDVVVKGYNQFERAGKSRLAVYKRLCDNVVEIDL